MILPIPKLIYVLPISKQSWKQVELMVSEINKPTQKDDHNNYKNW